MRNRILLALLPAGFIALAWACSSHPNATSPGGDSGADADASEDVNDASEDFGNIGDSSVEVCSYLDQSTGAQLDPVALCTQQQALTYEMEYAYTKGIGVAPGWSSTGTFAPLSGHNWQDDLGLAGAIGGYYCSSEVYGSSHSNAAFAAVLADLGKVLGPELGQNPPPYQGSSDGEIYFRLRWAQAAYNFANDTLTTSLKAMADAYGASLAAQAYAVAPAGGDGGSGGGVVIGTKNADGSVSYAPAQTMMAAAALLDMAVLGGSNPDAGPAVEAWATTAQQVIAYVLARGRDPVTGLFYQSLTTSSDPGHDAVGTGTPTNDAMLTATQAWIVLALARAQDLLDTYAMAPPPDASATGLPDANALLEAYWVAGNSVAAAATNAGLFDGNPNPPAAPATQPVGAFMEGLILSGSQVLTNKATIDNSIMLGGAHRVQVGAGSPLAYQLGEIRSALTQLQPARTSLLSIVTDQNGNLIQQSYLRAGSKAFGYAVAYTPGAEGGPEGTAQEQGATNYRSDAVHAMVEGLSQLWHGAANDARCAP